MRYSIEQFVPHLAASETPKRKQTGKAQHTERRGPDDGQSAKGLEHCAYIKRVCIDGAASLTEPGWKALATLLSKCDDGREFMHKWSAPYSGYDPEETDAKFDHAAKYGPATCKRIADELGGTEHCAGCPYAGKIRSPIQLTDPVVRLSCRFAYVISTGEFVEL
ncbi:MAG: hypothetical protein ACK4FJ_03560 [Ferrovibrio sp.]|uniref:hypothetical protein n=1 Tax=Ferrovibrio sp. TaxID=1917215 RepID=UPI00391BB8AC